MPIVDNKKGSATGFATLSAFKNVRASVQTRLALAGAALLRIPESGMRKQRFLHHAHWLHVPARNGPGALLFMSVFTGGFRDYLKGFTSALTLPMDEAWGGCEGWPGAKDEPACVAFIDRDRRVAQTFFNAYDSSGVLDVRQALRFRELLDAFAADAAGANDSAFENGFRALIEAWSPAGT